MGTLLENNFLNINPKSSSYRTIIIIFSLGTYEGNIVGVKLGCTLVATNGLPIGWSLGILIGML